MAHNNYHNHHNYHNQNNIRHEKREKITNCQRCGAEFNGRYGYSAFDASIICEKCKHQETNHPDYEKAVEQNKQEILAGNYSFKGIGLPRDLQNNY